MEKLIHHSIVRYFDSFEDEKDFSTLFEYMDGGDLRQMLNEGRLAEKTIVKMIVDILLALCFLSKHRIIHGDIKSENIFIRKNGSGVLGDFGCVKQLKSSQSHVVEGGLTKKICIS